VVHKAAISDRVVHKAAISDRGDWSRDQWSRLYEDYEKMNFLCPSVTHMLTPRTRSAQKTGI
jgi:hypothetical protein